MRPLVSSPAVRLCLSPFGLHRRLFNADFPPLSKLLHSYCLIPASAPMNIAVHLCVFRHLASAPHCCLFRHNLDLPLSLQLEHSSCLYRNDLGLHSVAAFCLALTPPALTWVSPFFTFAIAALASRCLNPDRLPDHCLDLVPHRLLATTRFCTF